MDATAGASICCCVPSMFDSSGVKVPLAALAQIRQAVEQGVPRAPVLADSAYGNETRFREGITELELRYAVGVHENMTPYGFLAIERTRFSPSARAGRLDLRAARIPPHFQPRGSPGTRRTA